MQSFFSHPSLQVVIPVRYELTVEILHLPVCPGCLTVINHLKNTSGRGIEEMESMLGSEE